MKFLTKKSKILSLVNCNLYGTKLKNNLKKKKWKYLINQKINLQTTKTVKPQAIKQFYKNYLIERQKLRGFYGFISDKKLKKLYNKINTKYKSFFINNLLIHLEQQIGCILWRLKIFNSLFEIKQYINHGFVKLNNNKLYNSHTIVLPGDVIWVDPTKIKFSNSKIILPGYLEWNKHVNLLTLLRRPVISEIQYPFKFNSKFIFIYLNNK